jgi:hypothetical protein
VILTALRSNSCNRRLTRVDRSEMHADFLFGGCFPILKARPLQSICYGLIQSSWVPDYER